MNYDNLDQSPGIYQIKNVLNGYSYIGSAAKLRKRCIQHIWDLDKKKHCNPYLQKVWNKYGTEAFEFYVLEGIDNRERLLDREQFFIDMLLPEYNVCPIAGSAKGRVPTPEHREKLRLAGLGKKYSPERREATRVGMNRMYAERPDVIERIRKSLTGKKQSTATKRKRSMAMRLQMEKNPLRFRIRPVQQFTLEGELIATFENSHQAAWSVNGSPESIRNVCLGRSKTSAGYRWKYAG